MELASLALKVDSSSVKEANVTLLDQTRDLSARVRAVHSAR